MNRALPPRDRGDRSADLLGPSGFGGTVSRACGLVCGITDSPKRKTPPGRTRRREGTAMVSGLSRNPVATLLFVAAEGLDLQSELLDQSPTDEPANGVALPIRRFHNLRERRALRTAQQVDHFGFFAALAGDVGRFLRGRARGVASFGLDGGLLPP